MFTFEMVSHCSARCETFMVFAPITKASKAIPAILMAIGYAEGIWPPYEVVAVYTSQVLDCVVGCS